MTHSDDSGLVLPPRLAPIHVVVVPIFRKAHERERVCEVGAKIKDDLAAEGLSVVFDDREGIKPGMKYYHWERRGVPLRLEVGPRDLEKSQAALKRRSGGDGQREFVPLAELSQRVPALLETMQKDLLEAARARREEASTTVDDWAAFGELFAESRSTFVHAHWCGKSECEAEVKSETSGVTIRCIPWDAAQEPGACIRCGGASPRRVLFARAY